ncbi:MAG: hypothetical protein E7218_02180 [Anaerofustis stercorihominis]|nr:hypothetical protein [Anaerofustis stercorihominis]
MKGKFTTREKVLLSILAVITVAIIWCVCFSADTVDYVDFSSDEVTCVEIGFDTGKKLTFSEREDIDFIHKMFDDTRIARSAHPDWGNFPWIALGGTRIINFVFYIDDGYSYHYELYDSTDLRVNNVYMTDKDGNKSDIDFVKVPLSPIISDFAWYAYDKYEPEQIIR